MNKNSKYARKFLKECTREEFEKAIYDANLTPTQEDIIRLHILKDKSVIAISMKLNLSERSVKKALSIAYLKISKCVLDKSLSNIGTFKSLFKHSA